MPNPAVVPYSDAVGRIGDKHLKASTLNATAVLLTALGADSLLVPVPGEKEKERMAVALEAIPPPRRRLIRQVDSNGRILQRISDFLTPLHEQARKWPETAFVSFSVRTLYGMAIGCKYRAMAVNAQLPVMLDFIDRINPRVFKAEAVHRLAEICFLATSYDPALLSNAEVISEVSRADVRRQFWRIIESSEFGAVTAISGKLGYLRNPRVALRRLKLAVQKLVSRDDFKAVVGAASMASELAQLPLPLSRIDSLVEVLDKGRQFSPPLLDIPSPVGYDIYRASLAEFDPKAVAPKGSILVVEYPLAGSASHSWLNEGEKSKFKYNARRQLASLRSSSKKAREASLRMVAPSP